MSKLISLIATVVGLLAMICNPTYCTYVLLEIFLIGGIAFSEARRMNHGGSRVEPGLWSGWGQTLQATGARDQ